MNGPTIDEKREIDQALHDGEGWALPPGTPPAMVDTLLRKGLIRMWKGRYQLTPAGYRESIMFEV